MEFKCREPSACLSFTPKLGFASFEGVLSHVCQQVQIPCCLAALALPFLDRVAACADDTAPLRGGFAGLLQRDIDRRTQAHFTSLPMNSDTQEPLPAATFAFTEPQAAGIRILAGTGGSDSQRT
jgi:hypothetical protein